MSLTHTPGNAPPENITSGHVLTSDGLALRYALARPKGRTRGTVVVLQGRGDFIERYFETFRELTARGFCVASFDWRGQGASQRLQADPLISNVPNFRLYADDLRSVMEKVVRKELPGPYFALAHSMGGCILLDALTREAWFERALLTSPMLDVNTGRWPRSLAHLVARVMFWLGLGNMLAPGRPKRALGPNDFQGNVLTSDKLRYDRDQRTLIAAPHLGIGPVTIGWMHAAFRAMAALARLPEGTRLKCPVLILAAAREYVTRSEACRAFARRVANAACIVVGESRHEILMERDGVRAQFWAAFDSFIGDHAPLIRAKASA